MINPQAKLFWHGRKVEAWLRGGHALPVMVEIAPTGFCNASCPWCFFKDKNDGGSINKEIMLTTLGELVRVGVEAINWTGGGEPTLHPYFDEFVIKAHSLGLEQGLFTNAYNEIKNPDLFKWIRISITDKGFAAIKKPGGYFGVCANQTITTMKKTLVEWCKAARDMGAKYFQVRPSLEGTWQKQVAMDPPAYLELLGTDNFKVIVSYSKYTDSVLPHGYDKCYGYLFCPSIDWKGKVGTCLYRMGEEKYVFGDLNKQTFTELWYRKQVSDDLMDSGCQNCCKNNEINKMLFAAKDIGHVNFL